MLSGCNKIIEIDLSKFYTLNVTSMNNMFNGCSSLISLNLSNINTSEVTMMKAMFCGCPSLISLDLSSFDTSKVSVIAGMFAEFPNLEYVNFKLIKLKQNVITEDIFYETNNKIIVCIENEENTLLYLLNKKIDIHCNNYNSYNENIKKCYYKESIINNKYICDICGNNYVLKNATKINNQYAICFGVAEGYYLDENDLTYKPCYNSCKICETSGDNNTNNCLECKENHYELNILNSNYKNCYINNTFEESDKSGYKIESTLFNNDGIHSLNELSSNIISNEIYQNQFENLTELILNKIKELIIDFDINDLNNGNDKKNIVKDKQILLTSTTNQKNNEKRSNITMDLGQCEYIIKNNYNISKNNSLYILQIISEEEGMKMPKIEYEIYYPLYNENELKKLDLTPCKCTKVDISIKVKIDGNIDKYNTSSDYYNNICSKINSESGADISLNDRRNEYVNNNTNNNISLCEENCKLIEYNYFNEKANCSCDIKTSIPPFEEIKFNKMIFLKVLSM